MVSEAPSIDTAKQGVRCLTFTSHFHRPSYVESIGHGVELLQIIGQWTGVLLHDETSSHHAIELSYLFPTSNGIGGARTFLLHMDSVDLGSLF